MQQLLQILVAGGDRRQQYAAQKLAKSPQLSVTTIGFSPSDSETLPEFDVLILPIHTTAESVPSKMELVAARIAVPCEKGGLRAAAYSPKLFADVSRTRTVFCDYFQREELCLANAVPTVEGAIQIAISERETVLCGSSVLVIGYGRIGTIMAERLQGLKADVTVAARSCKDAERCAANGLKWMHPSEIAARAGKFDWFCNTVPVLMLDETALSNMKPDALVIDLASKPGGTDFDAAKRLHRHVIWALGLPGIT
ncbi:MAG: dipicolinate synthase subunit DpsA, partial [Ruminococcus sp.]